MRNIGEVELNEVEYQDENVSSPKTEEQETISGPSSLKRYYFGCGPFHPNVLQFFAKKKFFTFLACCFTCLHSSVVSGFISVIISTIQIRYRFDSLSAGFIVIAYDLTVAIGITFVGYFTNFLHKPRVLGIACIVFGLTGLVFASPQFLFGTYESGTTSVSEEECQDNRTITVDCSSGNEAALGIFVLSSILLSLSSSVLYTLAAAYMDEIVYPRFVSLHIGTFQIFLVLGPAVGFLLGSACLTIYVDPWVETSLEQTDPAWVGAWWIPFIVVSIFSFVLSIPFLMYPRWLPDNHLVREERLKEMAKVYTDKQIDGHRAKVAITRFPTQMKRLLLNPSFMFASFGLAVSYIFSQGVVSFAPKFLENQFYLTSSVAGLVTGFIAIPGTVLGVAIGSLLLYIFKWNARQNIIAILTSSIVVLPFLLVFILHCPTIDLAGVTADYNDGSRAGIDESICAGTCNCTSTVFEPVCGEDGVTYFSACRAGCSVAMDNDDVNYKNCSCIADFARGFTLSNSTATAGLCESTCILLGPAVILFFVSVVLATFSSIPYQYFILRVVADDQRAVALGFQSTIWRIFGAVPGPLLFGALFDLSCVLWQEECGRRGNCWLYRNDKLSIYVSSVGFPCVFLSCCLFFLAFVTFPKKAIERSD